MAIVKVRTQLHVLYFAGDMPFSDAALKNLSGYVGHASTDSILLADLGDAIHASAEAFQPFETSAADRQAFDDDARADMRDDIARDEDMDHIRASVLDGDGA